MNGCDGDIAVAHGMNIDIIAFIVNFERAVEPVVGASARIEPLVKFFDKARAAHPSHFNSFELFIRQIGHVDVQQHAGRRRIRNDFFRQLRDHSFGHFPLRIDVGAKRKGNAGNSEDDALGRGRNRAGVNDANAGVGTQINATQNEIRRGVFHQRANGQLNAVGGRSADGIPEKDAILFNRHALDRVRQCDGVSRRATLHIGCNHPQFTQFFYRAVKHGDTGSVNTIIITKENLNGMRDTRFGIRDRRLVFHSQWILFFRTMIQFNTLDKAV